MFEDEDDGVGAAEILEVEWTVVVDGVPARDGVLRGMMELFHRSARKAE
jgi:hypothetical protein